MGRALIGSCAKLRVVLGRGMDYLVFMSPENTEKLLHIRCCIDAVDKELLALIATRQALVERVLPIKMAEDLPGRIEDRIAEVVNGMVGLAPSEGVDPELARAVWSTMVEWFVRHEEEVLARAPK